MDVFGTLTRWAGDAWSGITGLAGDLASPLETLWKYISAIQMSLAWVIQQLLTPYVNLAAGVIEAYLRDIQALRDALDRSAWWVWTYMIVPLRTDLLLRIYVLRLETIAHFAQLTNLVLVLHLVEERHTDILVAQERQQRIADIASARAYARALTTQLHQVVEQEAVAGYRAGRGIESTLLQQLAQDLNVRGVLDAVTTNLLIRAADVLVTIEDPALAAVANRIITLIVKRSGIGRDLGDLIDRLITPGAGGPSPKDLTGVIADLAHRIGQIEEWITKFMLDGGPEVEDVGRQLKTLNSPVVDIALVAFFAQAVAAPELWAREVNDTVGTVANSTIGSIIRLISHG